MTLRRVTAPGVSPVSIQEAKLHLRVDGDAEDDLIYALIDAATDHFDGEGALGRAMITQTWAQYFGQNPYRPRLKMTPFQSLTSVEYYDADNALQTDTLSNYETWVDGDYVICKPKEAFDWPDAFDRPDAIKVTYTAGYSDAATGVPQPIRQAILLTVGHWYESRVSVSEVAMKEVPMTADALISNYKIGWYG